MSKLTSFPISTGLSLAFYWEMEPAWERDGPSRDLPSRILPGDGRSMFGYRSVQICMKVSCLVDTWSLVVLYRILELNWNVLKWCVLSFYTILSVFASRITTYNTTLISDAKRDLCDLGLETYADASCYNFGKLPYGSLEKYKEGVMFMTYQTLIGKNREKETRLEQLVEWCGGEEFDGLIMWVVVINNCWPWLVRDEYNSHRRRIFIENYLYIQVGWMPQGQDDWVRFWHHTKCTWSSLFPTNHFFLFLAGWIPRAIPKRSAKVWTRRKSPLRPPPRWSSSSRCFLVYVSSIVRPRRYRTQGILVSWGGLLSYFLCLQSIICVSCIMWSIIL